MKANLEPMNIEECKAIAADYLEYVETPFLDVDEAVELAKRLEVDTGSKLRDTLNLISREGGVKLRISFSEVCKAMQGKDYENVRPSGRWYDSSKSLPPLDFEIPLPVPRDVKGRSKSHVPKKWVCDTGCRFWQACKASKGASILPCEGFWIEEIQGLELIT